MVDGRGTARPYVKFIGASATGVTQSCHVVRFGKYVIMLDCGLYQESDIKTNYESNTALLKKIRPRSIDYIILSHQHIDHSGLVPALYARGCQAHIITPMGATPFLRLLWQDSMKIFTADCQKLQNKHGMKAKPYYTQADIDNAINRIMERDRFEVHDCFTMRFIPSNHILYACQVYLDFTQGGIHHRLGYTGDIGGTTPQPWVEQRENMPYCNMLIAENTYNQPGRMNKAYDRAKDMEKIATVINEKRRVLIPAFSLGRTQTIIHVLHDMWVDGKIPSDVRIVVDSPLSQKICQEWPDDDGLFKWGNLHFVCEWTESQALQASNTPIIVIASSGFLTGGRAVEWLKSILPNPDNHVLFCGYTGENTLAAQIRYGQRAVNVNGAEVANNANITELVSFSSHASYEELLDYYTSIRYDKIALVHGDGRYKPNFCAELERRKYKNGDACKVICVTADSKIYF